MRRFLGARFNIEVTNAFGKTPLHCAAAFQSKHTITVLVDWVANLHALNTKDSNI
jgi:ankyrin repeat protein